jgi:hypothetical protein
MQKRPGRLMLAATALAVAAAVYAALGAASPTDLTNVPSANPKAVGFAPPAILSPELLQTAVGQGSTKLENGTVGIPYYGYDGDGPMVPALGSNVEATKTEPDKNTYLVLKNQTGPDQNYNYGTHFLFQGHENGTTVVPDLFRAPNTTTKQKQGYITRINLDADAAHRVTLMASAESTGGNLPLPVFDGSTWDPFASRLLFTAENGSSGGVWQATLNYPSQVQDISGSLGRAGYEGIQNDSAGDLYVVEDTGGAFGSAGPPNLTTARQPNSFIYRFLPKDPTNLNAGGKLQALQVISLANPGQPIVFHSGQADADILSQDTKDLHTYGHVFTTHWVTVHDTSTDGTTPFDANAAAKAHNATPFKRPENGLFRPGSKFTEFYFDETGDTNATTGAGADYGGFGGIQKLTQSPSSNDGTLTLLYQSNLVHTAFDNTAFLTRDRVAFVEDRGDTLHTQQNALDSAWVFDVGVDYSNPVNQPLRMLAQGRDASATIDSGLSGTAGFQNDGDNEITGIHVSDGDATAYGILGSKIPSAWSGTGDNSWRVFYTQQHGDNVTYEILHD